MSKKTARKKGQRKTVVKDLRVTLRINSKLLNTIEERATKEHTTVSGLITRALLHYMDTVPEPRSSGV